MLEICDCITVLRDGKNIATEPVEAFDMDRLVSLMVGRDAETFYSRQHTAVGEVVFELEEFSCPDKKFKDIILKRGKILYERCA